MERFFRCACTYIYHEKSGKFKHYKITFSGNGNEHLFTALTSVAGLLSNQSQMVGFWVSGGFRGATWLDVKIILAAGIPGFLAAVLLAPKINVISLGDDMATGLGIHPQRVRFITILLMIPLCAAAVVVGKTIGFVGLMIPQTIRLFAGTDYRRVIPLSFLCGAVLLTYADIAARMIYQPYEVPIGIFTAMLGVPFFYTWRERSGDDAYEKRKQQFCVRDRIIFCAILLGLCWGSYEISVHEVIATLLGNGTKIQNTAIFGIRLPRILLGIFVAAGLAISGGVLQTMTRNELADPGIIGINAGGATAAVLFIQFQTNAYFSELGTFSIYLLPLMAISGALAAAFCIYFLSSRKGLKPKRLLLTGIGINAGLNAFITFLCSREVLGITTG